MTSIPVVALYGALSAIFFVVISANVSWVRSKSNTWVGGKEIPPELHRAMRAQGNTAEYLPLALFLLLVLELAGASSLWLHVLGGGLLLLRVLFAVGIVNRISSVQTIGATGTYLLITAEAVYALVLRFR
jgi:uncharacterized protein